MSDYKFDILNTLVKFNDFEDDEILFLKNLEKYHEILQELYDVKFIDRQLTVKHKGDLDGIHQSKITSAGRQYFYDVLLPSRLQTKLVIDTPNINEKKHSNKVVKWVLKHKDIIGIILTIIGIIVAILMS